MQRHWLAPPTSTGAAHTCGLLNLRKPRGCRRRGGNVTMNSIQRLFLLLLVTPHSISLGLCDAVSFSICWMSKENMSERENFNLWLNVTSLRLVGAPGAPGALTSVTVPPLVDNRLGLQLRGALLDWTLAIVPRTKFTKVTGRLKPRPHPTNSTRAFLDSLSPSEVFACERSTLFFHQEEHFFLAVGHTTRLPVRLEARSSSMLLLTWPEAGGGAGGGAEGGAGGGAASRRTVTLYHSELGSYARRSAASTALSHHRLAPLDACSRYLVCVELAGGRTSTCIATLTDPDVPQHFEVTSWNSSSVALAWDCPANRRYSLFLLTAFHLDGADQVTREAAVWLRGGDFTFSLRDLQPCSRLRFGLQTVCEAGAESRYSSMVLSDGNAFHSDITALRQAASGPGSYTLSWAVGNSSSISAFRVLHQGAPRGTTLATSFTVGGLPPCRRYQARVAALCGHSVVMSSRTVVAHTGPQGVTELRFRPVDSTALWTPGTPPQPGLAFVYQLTPEGGAPEGGAQGGGAPVRSGRLDGSELHLAGLEEGRSYVLEVWEECGGRWRSDAARLTFLATNRTRQRARAAGGALDSGPAGVLGDSAPPGLVLVLPWSLPEELQDDASGPAELKTVLQQQLQRMLTGSAPPPAVEVLTGSAPPPAVEVLRVQPAEETNRTHVVFACLSGGVRRPLEEQLAQVRVLGGAALSVKDGVVYWEGPDLCASRATPCPAHSLCVATLGSASCICQRSFYDVSGAMEPPAASPPPLCREKGLFSQCLSRLLIGGISRSFLSSYLGGEVEVKLNDGRCAVNRTDSLFFFRTARTASACGTQRQVNQSHVRLQNVLTARPGAARTISRRELTVVWRCVYARHYARNAHVSVDMEWLSSVAQVELNSTLPLGLAMTLFRDRTFTRRYAGAAALAHDDTLFFQVALRSNASFASDLLLRVEGCWATESPHPQDRLQGVLLQDGCPVDATFRWLSENGSQQSSRFSVQMFSLPRQLPLYFHCRASLCGRQDTCTQDCGGGERRGRRSAARGGSVVSAGPLVVSTRTRSVPPAAWAEQVTMASIVAGSAGFLCVVVLSVVLHHERRRRRRSSEKP